MYKGAFRTIYFYGGRLKSDDQLVILRGMGLYTTDLTGPDFTALQQLWRRCTGCWMGDALLFSSTLYDSAIHQKARASGFAGSC